MPNKNRMNNRFTSLIVCDVLARQRTSFGEDLPLGLEHDPFIRQTYYFTYNKSGKTEGIRVNRRLQQFRQISSYIWILVATSLTFTHLAHLQEFDECIRTIEAWVDKYPIPEHLEREACMLLQVLDAQVDSILTDGRKIGKKISQRKIPLGNRFPFHRKCNDILSRTTIPMNTSRNKLIQARWKFLHSIDSMCKSDQTSIAQVMSDEQLDDLLKQPFDKPIFWQNYTQHYPLHGVPNSIPDFLAELHQLDIKSLEAHDYAKNKNHSVYLDDIAEHFQNHLCSVRH
jgi:hypothetical protein